MVIDFFLNDPDIIKKNPSVGRILIYSLNEIEEWKYKEAGQSVLDLFLIDTTTTIKISALNALLVTAKGEIELINGLNKWLNRQNTLFLSQMKPDHHVVNLCINTLGMLGDESSFPYIFTAMILVYSDHITGTARQALYLIQGDIKVHLLKIINNGTLFNKYGVLKFTLNEKELDSDTKKDIIKNSLRVAYEVGTPTQDEHEILKKIRYLAIQELIPYKLGEITDLVIKHFKTIKVDYDKGIENNAHMIDVLDCLGSMGTHKAAVTCTEYLEYINLYTEKKRVFDEQIILVLINNLDILGDEVAIDALQYTAFLNYTDRIKKAAQETADKILGI